jgi:hypothetical protein
MALPTSAGKSLIAEVMLLRCVTEIRKKALLILPYVCLVVEKEDALEKLFEPTEHDIQSFYGSKGRIPLSPGAFVGVATIEKGSIIINSLIEENRLQELALVVIDEIHMLSEVGNGLHRGAIIESMICKLKVFAPHVQIIGMSATIPNAQQIASFMRAQYNSWQFRPVKLENRLQIRTALLNAECVQIQTLHSSDALQLIPRMLLEVAPHSALVFCPTRHGMLPLAIQTPSCTFSSLNKYADAPCPCSLTLPFNSCRHRESFQVHISEDSRATWSGARRSERAVPFQRRHRLIVLAATSFQPNRRQARAADRRPCGGSRSGHYVPVVAAIRSEVWYHVSPRGPHGGGAQRYRVRL